MNTELMGLLIYSTKRIKPENGWINLKRSASWPVAEMPLSWSVGVPLTNHFREIVVTNSIYDFGKIQFCYSFGASIVWILDYFIIFFVFLEKV